MRITFSSRDIYSNRSHTNSFQLPQNSHVHGHSPEKPLDQVNSTQNSTQSLELSSHLIWNLSNRACIGSKKWWLAGVYIYLSNTHPYGGPGTRGKCRPLVNQAPAERQIFKLKQQKVETVLKSAQIIFQSRTFLRMWLSWSNVDNLYKQTTESTQDNPPAGQAGSKGPTLVLSPAHCSCPR